MPTDGRTPLLPQLSLGSQLPDGRTVTARDIVHRTNLELMLQNKLRQLQAMPGGITQHDLQNALRLEYQNIVNKYGAWGSAAGLGAGTGELTGPSFFKNPFLRSYRLDRAVKGMQRSEGLTPGVFAGTGYASPVAANQVFQGNLAAMQGGGGLMGGPAGGGVNWGGIGQWASDNPIPATAGILGAAYVGGQALGGSGGGQQGPLVVQSAPEGELDLFWSRQ